MKKVSKEVIVGLFTAIGLVLLYLGFNYLKGIDFFSTTTKYFAVYDNVDQLAPSNPVLLNGYAVGRVSHIKILRNKGNRVLVELDIDSDVKLGDSTKAILTNEFLSGRYILLNVGPVDKPLKSGDTLRSEVAKGLFDVFTESAEPVADNLQTTIRNFNAVIDNLSHNTKQLDTILRNLQGTPGYLNRTIIHADGKIEELSRSIVNTSENLNATLNQLKPTLDNFRTLSDSLKRMRLNQTLTKTQQTLSSLNETLGRLKKGDNTAGRLLTEDSLYVNLNKLLVNLDTLVKHFDNNPKHFLGPLGKSQKKIERDRKKEAEQRKATGAKK